MSVLSDIADMTAELLPVEDAPTAPLGFGRDLSCVSDVTPDFAEVGPTTALGIAQAAVRRLTTPRGQLIDDENYGLDVRAFANRGMTELELRDLSGQVRVELAKDDRVESADAQVLQERSSLSISVQLTPVDPNTRAFSFTIAVTSTQVLLETIS
jgi:hypothetical protein